MGKHYLLIDIARFKNLNENELDKTLNLLEEQFCLRGISPPSEIYFERKEELRKFYEKNKLKTPFEKINSLVTILRNPLES